MRKKRQATHKAYKKRQNAQSTAKKDILRKTNRQDTQNSINNTKSTDLKQKKNKTQQTTFNGKKIYKRTSTIKKNWRKKEQTNDKKQRLAQKC